MKNWTYKNYTIHHFPTLESTNVTAFEKARSKNLFDREIILTDQQTGGKGRQMRVWSSPQGNLYFSLLLQPQVELAKIPQISFVAITALRLAVESLVKHHKISNKWPNDLLIDQKKVAGLLLESEISQNICEFVVVGIGVNLLSNPQQTIFPASNLKNFGVEISAEIMLKSFLDEFEKLYQNWLDFGFAGIRKLWLQAAFRLNEEITVKNKDKEIRAIFRDLDNEGNLVLEIAGNIEKISAADIF